MALSSDSEIVAHNLSIAAELRRVVEALGAAGIPCIVLKGIPLCQRLGDRLEGRALADNDILVHRADVLGAMQALGRLEYRSLSWRNLDHDLEQGFEHPLGRAEVGGRQLVCELHWNAFPPSLFRATEELLWARSVEVEVFGARVRVFDPALQLLHLASHVVQHELCEPRTLTTFARAWARWSDEIDRSELARMAKEIGIERVLEYLLGAAAALGLVEEEVDVSGSRSVAIAGTLLRAERLLEPAEERYPERYFRAIVSLLLLEPSLALGHAVGRVFPAPEWHVREQGRGAMLVHYMARPWRPIARSLRRPKVDRLGLRARWMLATAHYVRVHRSLAVKYPSLALDELFGELESEAASPHPLPLSDLARAIRLAERLLSRLSTTPNTCLFRALSRYALLNVHAHHPSFVLGVGVPADQPGHAWVELRGEPFLEPSPPLFARILTRRRPD